MLFKKKRPGWFWPSLGWLLFCSLLYWFSKRFMKAAAKLNDWRPKIRDKETV